VLGDTTVAGTFYRGRHATREQIARPRGEWLALSVEPIVDAATFELAQRLRTTRESRQRRGAVALVHVLGGLVRCGRCGASFGLESSGKRIDGGVYRYCYYNCRTTLRTGKQACAGQRIPMRELDQAVLTRIADAVCTPARANTLCRALRRPIREADELREAWRALIMSDAEVGTTYARRLIARVVVTDDQITIEPRAAPSENAPP
jgi:site-specific DNA recombinase